MARDQALSSPALPAGNLSGPGVGQRPVTDTWARFNFFQRMMLRWRELHPYNPVHVVRVPAALDAQRLRACIAEHLESLGLTGLSVDQGRWRYRFEGGPAAVELSVLAAGDDAQGLLSRTIEREFNRPFEAAAREQPFRFIAIDEGAAFQLVLVYDHYVASGDSIARLLTHLACSLAEPDAPLAPLALACRSSGYRGTLLRHPGWVLKAVLGLPRLVADARHAWRVRHAAIDDGRNAFVYLRIDATRTRALRLAARQWGVTFNDLITACLLQALSPLAAQRRAAARRNRLAVASILNMRRDLHPDDRDAVSPFLAAFRVSHDVPEGISLQQLAQDVQRQTSRIKRHHLYLQSLLALAVSALLWPLLTPSQRHGFYPKHFAVWAGVTSLDLNALWGAQGGVPTAGLDYLRAVPTGPLCPLVLAVTSVHDELHLGFAYRTSVFSRESVQGLASALLRQAEALRDGLVA
ncbi:MAG: hypothetical protein MUF16_14125 [Burkholderiaceae bacterium]|nr:hypothetical protein [Burkholderiaceae bacterium]